MKIKTSELVGSALDWAVARCEGIQLNDRLLKRGVLIPTGIRNAIQSNCNYSPTKYWAQSGPIIDRERIELYRAACGETEACIPAEDGSCSDNINEFGPTGPIAAMRCYVRSKLGDEVEVPDELVNAA